MSTSIRTSDQERAADALTKIQKLADQNYGHYLSYVSSLPATIVMNGLGQAMATLFAQSKGKKDDPHYRLFEHVATWLGGRFKKLESDQPDGVLQKLMDNDQDLYVRAQVEAMAYLHWLKQFSRAYLREGANESRS